MNSQDFQTLCSNLKSKYEEKLLTDADVDAFADVVSNVLGREDLRAEGTEYDKLSKSISGNYEGDVDMTPLLARMYELCRMYENFRPRPLTELEQKEIQHASEVRKARKPAVFIVYDGITPIANCWFEDLIDTAGIAAKAAEIAKRLPKLSDIKSDSSYDYSAISKAFINAGAGFDPVDEEGIGLSGLDEVPFATDREDGIICLADGQERNRMRKGSQVKISLSDGYIRCDCYTVYGIDFYEELSGKTVSEMLETLSSLDGAAVEYPIEKAEIAARTWKEMSDPFKIPGSPKLIGTKKPVSAL